MRIRVFGHYVYASIAVLAIVEALVFFGAVYGAALVRFHGSLSFLSDPSADLSGALWPRAVLFSAVTVMCLLAFGLYSARQRARLLGIALRILLAVLMAFLVASALFYLIPNLWIGRGVVSLAALGAFLGVVASRSVFSRVVDEDVFKRRVLIYGAGRSAATIAELRRRADRRGFHVVGFVPAPGEVLAVDSGRLLTPAGSLVDLCQSFDVVEVVVSMDDRRRGFPISELLSCRLAGVDVTEQLTFLERETGRVRLDILNPAWLIFGEGFRRNALRRLSARALDLSAALVVLALAWPFMLLTALAIKIEDGFRAPVLYRQRRVGLLGEPFELLKFRSMRVDAEKDGAQWARKGDTRVTKVGAFIRKVRLDELPQLLNVLRGQMSFVGPRPERPEFVAELAERIPYYVERHSVKPGLTGWAQLCYPYGSSEQDALEKLQYDLYYVKNNTLLFDLAILVQTAEVVFLGKGAR